MQSKATTIEAYLKALPEDRRVAINAIRKVINRNLGRGFQEGMQYGMIGYFVPHSVYPPGYHCDPRQPLPFVQIASQKNHIGLYLFCVYMDEKLKREFEDAWKKTGKKLDMGKACVRCRNLEGIALDAIGDTIRKFSVESFIATYESILPPSKRSGASASGQKKTPAKKKTSVKKKLTKKAPARKTAAKKVPARKAATKKKAGGKTSKAS
ncbi:MAG TPA: DUF1801 domain-containing protein [Phycisphaerae bacterium]|nr:DUF1801 domain-containing protein [Phycisphaerae bacterium]HRW53655.1 DUF1801 domain-containing protein [Phycisphaerae bacterium]